MPLCGSVRSPLVAALVLACGGAQQQASGLYLLPSEECASAVTRIEAIDEPTPLGFAAIDALMRLDGPRASPLVWLEPEPNSEYALTLGPERGRSTIEVDVRAGEGSVLHRFSTPGLAASDETACDTGALEIPVIVTLESSAQGLSESFDAMLEARTPYRGHIRHRFEPAALRGSLGLASVTSLDPERSFWLGPLSLDLEVWEGGSRGALAVEIGASHAKEAAGLRLPPEPPAQPGSIVAWPSSAGCEGESTALPSDAKVLGFSVDDVLSELRARAPRTVTWSDGNQAKLVLELEVETPEPCQAAGDSLSFRAMLRAQREAGIEVRSPVRIDALDAGGRVGAIRIESAEPDVPSPVIHSVTSGSGRPRGIDRDGYTAVLVGLEWTLDGERDSGSLSLRGVDARAPGADGVYPSTQLPSARW